VHETAEDIARLQRLLDASDERAGRHLREIITAERRLGARETCGRLVGMRLLALATMGVLLWGRLTGFSFGARSTSVPLTIRCACATSASDQR
jgi:hypothetical protein